MPRQGRQGKRPKRTRKARARNVHRVVGVRGEGAVSERDQSSERGRGVRVGRNRQLERQDAAGSGGKLGVREPDNARQDGRQKPMGRAAGRLEGSTPQRGKGKGRGSEKDGLAYVFQNGRIVRAVPPEAPLAPAVQAGPGLESGIPLPVLPPAWKDRSTMCRCGLDVLRVRYSELLTAAGINHAAHCPQFVAPVLRVTGCRECDTTNGPHFHDKHILFEAGKELF